MTFLNIFAVVPVTRASDGRSFSVMKLEKNYLGAKLSNERLNGLALMIIRKNIRIDHNAIAETYLASPVRELTVAAEENHEIKLDEMVDQTVDEYDHDVERETNDEVVYSTENQER